MLPKFVDTLGPLSIEALRRAEAETGMPLPEQYREFLRKYNGGRLEPAYFPVQWQGQSWAQRFPYDAVHVLFGLQENSPSDLLTNLRDYWGRIPEDTLPIGRDPGGNLLLLGVIGPNTNKVFLWVQDYEVEEGEEPDYRNIGLVAPSFDEFLHSLYAR